MTGHLLLRGMLAGLIAGLVAFGFARFYGEPQVDLAIAFEELMAAAEAPADATAHEEPEAVSRETQAGIGLFTGVVTYSVAMGGIFSLVFAGLYGRAGRLGPRSLAVVLGAAAFVALIIVPDLKYPPNPPAVGDPETIGVRTGLFFVTLVASIFALSLAVMLARRLGEHWDRWNAVIVAGIAYVVFLAIVFRLLPTINEVPENFPSTALYDFRLATLGLQFTLWTVLSLAFGYLAEKSLQKSGNYRSARAA
ncbi:CbtA family protein [Ensifer adhaerens]|uniref:CbtA family protein n=1 Tax=Ensifer adhaerens TaxID=106592 RepID=UPI003D0777BE